MGTIVNNNANVAYNYQKVPNLVTSNQLQSQAGLAISLSDKPNQNRNVAFLFPTNLSTPNYGAGSPTLLARSSIQTSGDVTYAGRQTNL
jgi:hypothetical protein